MIIIQIRRIAFANGVELTLNILVGAVNTQFGVII